MNLKMNCQDVTLEVIKSKYGVTINISALTNEPSQEDEVLKELEKRIAACNTIRELYLLLFAVDDDSKEVLDLFTKRRLEIDGILPLEGQERLERA